MCEPTAQDYNSNVRTDDPAILGPHRLVRHLVTPLQIVRSPEGLKISSQAFITRKEHVGISIDLECLLVANGKKADSRFGSLRDTLAMGVVTADDARQSAQGVAWTPKPLDETKEGAARDANPEHGEIILGDMGTSARRKASRALSERCQIIRQVES